MQVKKLSQSILNLPDWAQFLSRSSVIIAAVLFGSALIMAIAANWLSWPKPLRVVLIQVTITALVLFAWKRGQQEPKEWASVYSLSSLSVNLAAIAIGALLALIGQSYQTGADPWWLFAIWAALLVPWLLALQSPFIILLVLLLTNVAVFLFAVNIVSVTSGLPMGLCFAAINIGAIYLSRYSQIQHIVQPIALLMLGLATLWWQLLAWSEMMSSSFIQGLLYLAIFTGLGIYYSRLRVHFLTAMLCYMAVYVQVILLLLFQLDSFDLGIALLLFGTGTLLGGLFFWDLRRLWQKNTALKEPWFLRLMYLLVNLIVAFFLLLIYVLLIGELNVPLAHFFVLMAVAAIVLIQRRPISAWTQDLPLLLWFGAAALGLLTLNSANHYLNPSIAWLLLLSVVVYVLSPQNWLLRFCSAGSMVLLAVGWWFNYFHTFGYLQLGLLAAVLIVTAILHYKPSLVVSLKPLWWAWVVALLLWLGWEPPSSRVFTVLPPSALLALLGWSWAYAQRDHVLFWASVYVLVVSLGQHYYQLQWSLLHKALVFAAGGVLLALCAWGLQRYINRTNPNPHSNPDTNGDAASSGSRLLAIPKHIAVGLWLGLGAVLLVSAQDVARKEYLLATGTPVVLQLAPVDPRSLMQGDYMALDFTISQQIARILQQENALGVAPTNTARLLAYVSRSESALPAPSRLVALKNPANSSMYWVEGAEKDLDALAVILMQRHQGRWLPNGVNAWFFPEGQAGEVAHARFGEFKTNARGRALLYQLID